MLAPRPLERLIEVLSMLPSVGRKSAQRLAFFLLKQNEKHVSDLAAAILEAKEKIISCEKCFNYTEISPCAVCEDEKRVSGQLCVVEQASIVYAIENTGLFKGRYHVLGGLISPLDGVGPSDIHLFQLKDRIQSEGVNEIIMALNVTAEGEATSLYIQKMLEGASIKITKLAHGIPVGGDLEYVDHMTVQRAMEGRQEF